MARREARRKSPDSSSFSGYSVSTAKSIWGDHHDDDNCTSTLFHDDDEEESSSRAALHFSFAEHQEDLDSNHQRQASRDRNQRQPYRQHDSYANQHHAASSTATAPASPSAASTSNTGVPADQERQILLLMLLAQVCALHDPTPRTFTVHVLELFERGILDRQSIHFLFDLGLVPSTNPSGLLLSNGGPTTQTSSSSPQNLHEERSLVTAKPSAHIAYRQRSLEASAIRSTLERHEQQQQQQQHSSRNTASSTPTAELGVPPPVGAPLGSGEAKSASWSAEHHPLSLSRYQREFDQVGLLSSGSFGQVYRATNKMDGRDYAIKRVPFSAKGYSRDSVQQVVREVHCLAVCDHPHVVRYYTSWLEPSWMTGSGNRVVSGAMAKSSGRAAPRHQNLNNNNTNPPPRHHQKLLQDITRLVDGTGDSRTLDDVSDDLEAYFKDQGTSTMSSRTGRRRLPTRRYSFDASESTAWSRQEESEWSINDDNMIPPQAPLRLSKDDSFLDNLFGSSRGSSTRQGEDGGGASDRATGASHDDDISVVSAGASYHHHGQRGQHLKKQQQQRHDNYRYQICLFIQMQLCNPRTLADWIRERNRSLLNVKSGNHSVTTADLLGPATQIFSQIVLGLAHVHKKGIIHRDLKPANCFACTEDGLRFKIGDFGLSKLIQSFSTSGGKYPHRHQHHRQEHLLLLEYGGIMERDNEDASSCDGSNEPSWRDPLTAGVGTASYAAPEQVSTRDYGKEADIFSLGLMLLELVCCFSTEHERIQTFHDCRYRRTVPDKLAAFPILEQTVLKCTDPDGKKRPTADDLAIIDLCRRESTTDDQACEKEEAILSATTTTSQGRNDYVQSLELQLAEREKEVFELKHVIAEQKGTIASLNKRVEELTSMPSRVPLNTNGSFNGGGSRQSGHVHFVDAMRSSSKGSEENTGNRNNDEDDSSGPAAYSSSSSDEDGL